MIQKESYGFKTFVGVRIGEIQELTNKEDWYWIEGTQNIADIISRGAAARDLREGSEWQNGPAFLKLPEEEWPIKQSYSGQELPETIVMAAAIETKAALSDSIDIERFSSYDKLIRVT